MAHCDTSTLRMTWNETKQLFSAYYIMCAIRANMLI